MTEPVLSICIATYNRAAYIAETLDSIIPQITDEVEIVVVDGASTDATGSIIRHYCEACKQLSYIRLPAKGGVDRDYCKAIEYARGAMCWLFPDDDLLKPNAVSAVLNAAKRGYSLIVVNSQVFNKDFSQLILPKNLRIDSDQTCGESDLDLLFQRIMPYLSYIGCVIIDRELWLQRDQESYFGTEFVHVGVIFQAPLPAPALLIADPLVSIRYGNAQWTSRSFEIWFYKWPQLIASFAHVQERTRQDHQLTRPWPKLKHLMISRAKGSFSLREFHKFFSSKSTPLWLRLTSFSIAVIPFWVVNLMILTLFKLMKKESQITIFDLKKANGNISNTITSGQRPLGVAGRLNLRPKTEKTSGNLSPDR